MLDQLIVLLTEDGVSKGLYLVVKLLWVFKFIVLLDLHFHVIFNVLLDLVNIKQGLVVPINFLVGSNLNPQRQLNYSFLLSCIGEFKGFSILGLGMVR